MTALADAPLTELLDATLPRDPTDADLEAQGWRKDGQGRWSTSPKPGIGKKGNVYRRGNETPEEARERDATEAGKDKPPKPRKQTVKPGAKPPAPTKTDLKELEYQLAEALKAPAMICMMVGDEWPAAHFTTHGPIFARKLVRASETNPWLRAKLEKLAAGDEMLVNLVNALGLSGALLLYAAPPAIYYLNPKFIPREADEMLGIPGRKADETPDAPIPTPPARAPAAAPAAAAAA